MKNTNGIKNDDPLLRTMRRITDRSSAVTAAMLQESMTSESWMSIETVERYVVRAGIDVSVWRQLVMDGAKT